MCYFQALDTVNKNKIFKLFTTNNNYVFHTQPERFKFLEMLKLPYFYVYFIDEINFVNSIFHYIKCKLLNCKVAAEKAYEVLPQPAKKTDRQTDIIFSVFYFNNTRSYVIISNPDIHLRSWRYGNKVHKRKRRLIYPSWTGHQTCFAQTSS